MILCGVMTQQHHHDHRMPDKHGARNVLRVILDQSGIDDMTFAESYRNSTVHFDVHVAALSKTPEVRR